MRWFDMPNGRSMYVSSFRSCVPGVTTRGVRFMALYIFMIIYAMIIIIYLVCPKTPFYKDRYGSKSFRGTWWEMTPIAACLLSWSWIWKSSCSAYDDLKGLPVFWSFSPQVWPCHDFGRGHPMVFQHGWVVPKGLNCVIMLCPDISHQVQTATSEHWFCEEWPISFESHQMHPNMTGLHASLLYGLQPWQRRSDGGQGGFRQSQARSQTKGRRVWQISAGWLGLAVFSPRKLLGDEKTGQLVKDW